MNCFLIGVLFFLVIKIFVFNWYECVIIKNWSNNCVEKFGLIVFIIIISVFILFIGGFFNLFFCLNIWWI